MKWAIEWKDLKLNLELKPLLPSLPVPPMFTFYLTLVLVSGHQLILDPERMFSKVVVMDEWERSGVICMAYKLSYFVGPDLSPLPLVLEMEFQLEVGGLFLGVFY